MQRYTTLTKLMIIFFLSYLSNLTYGQNINSSATIAPVLHNNNPVIGSKQSSTEIFGNQNSPKRNAQSHNGKQMPTNPATQGSTTSSTQTFGNPKVTGSSGKHYYTREQLIKTENPATQGSATSSDQTFKQ